MRFALHTRIPSPHQLPLAKELVKIIGARNFRYFHDIPIHREYVELGWRAEAPKEWFVSTAESPDEAREWLEGCDVLASGVREFDIFERRVSNGLKTAFISERLLKPPVGILRMLSPKFLGMMRRHAAMMDSSEAYHYLPTGVHAARDMARILGLLKGDARCFFRVPSLTCELVPGGRVSWAGNDNAGTSWLDRTHLWGYFVDPPEVAQSPQRRFGASGEVRVLWAGRMLGLKRVDTIIRAVAAYAQLRKSDQSLPAMSLDIVGCGPEEARLRHLASRLGSPVQFLPPVPMPDVRGIMRAHDVYVLSSNGFEGWGAVVSEALEENMVVFATRESGAGPTILPQDRLFHVGDVDGLLGLLTKAARGECPPGAIGDWTASYAAKRLLGLFA